MQADIGARIGIDGEKAFRDSLGAINSQMKNLGSEMKAVVSAFAGMENSEEAVAAKSDVLQRSIQASADKIELLQGQSQRAKKKLDELAVELSKATEEFGANSAEALKAQNAYNRQVTVINKLETQINQTTAEMSKMEREMKNVGRAADNLGDDLKEVGKNAEDAKDEFLGSLGGNILSGAIQSLAGSVMDLVESTAEYRKVMGTLETSSEEAGYSVEQTKETYTQLQGVIGDNQASATAAANLQALCLEQEKLKKLTEGAIGAWATYGDSIPIDGLAEAINETVKVGKVTGTFADVLNWAGTSEDAFNAKLEAAGSQAERANIVLEELANQGLMDTAKAWRQSNAEIVAANEASANLEVTTARLGEMLSPLVTSLKEGLNKILSGVLDIYEQGSPLLALVAGLTTAIAGMGLAMLITQGAESVTMLTKMKTAFAALTAVMKANPILLVVSLLAGLVAALVTAYQTNEEFRIKVDTAWQTLKESVGAAIEKVKSFVDGLREKFQIFINWLGNIPAEMKELGINIITGLWNGINEKVAWLKGKVSSMVDLVKGLFSGTDGFDTHSPSKWAKKIGGWVMDGLGNGITDNTSAIENAKNATEAIKDALMGAAVDTTLTATVQAKTENMEPTMLAIIAGLQAQEELLFEYLEQLKEKILVLLQSFIPQWRKVGGQMMEGLARGIKENARLVINAIVGVIREALKEVQEMLGIESPSKVFAEIGEYSMEGFAIGVQNRLKNTLQTMGESMESITSVPNVATTAAGNTSNSYAFGDVNIYIDKISSEREAKTIAREIEFIRRQEAAGKGGIA